MTVTEKSAGVLVFLKQSATLHYLLLHDNEDQWRRESSVTAVTLKKDEPSAQG